MAATEQGITFYDQEIYPLKSYHDGDMYVIAVTGLPGVHAKGASATFYQVASICTEFDFLYITDAQAGRVRLVTSGRGMTRVFTACRHDFQSFQYTLGTHATSNFRICN